MPSQASNNIVSLVNHGQSLRIRACPVRLALIHHKYTGFQASDKRTLSFSRTPPWCALHEGGWRPRGTLQTNEVFFECKERQAVCCCLCAASVWSEFPYNRDPNY